MLAAVALGIAASHSSLAEAMGHSAPRFPRAREPKPFDHTDEQRLAAAQAKRDRKAAKRRQTQETS